MSKQEIIDILDNCRNHCDHQIPYYAFGDNEAACEMSNTLRQIGDDLSNVLEFLRTPNPDSPTMNAPNQPMTIMKYRIYADGEIVHEDEFSAQDGMIPYREDYGVVVIPDELEAHIISEENTKLKAALSDMLSGWRYIREVHGDLYGVGWDRAQDAAEKILSPENK